MIFDENGDMMLAFFKKMDSIFSMIGIVCPALIKSRKPADVRVFFRNFRCVALKWYSASR